MNYDPNPRHRCDVCGEKFFTPYAVSAHKAMVHAVPKSEAGVAG